uniref:Uncharacterized protein n=1 Tax=Craspedostauros australis TaxID=1486917 RepID=A0A7R9ZRC0_9STRA|mmetsp:Transcript_6894/g.18716  ORF Transcript_6894/g.18716 Transcript_6894/m.18716 type:complete len:389 (+) Transcript_6894:33-1199(+)
MRQPSIPSIKPAARHPSVHTTCAAIMGVFHAKPTDEGGTALDNDAACVDPSKSSPPQDDAERKPRNEEIRAMTVITSIEPALVVHNTALSSPRSGSDPADIKYRATPVGPGSGTKTFDWDDDGGAVGCDDDDDDNDVLDDSPGPEDGPVIVNQPVDSMPSMENAKEATPRSEAGTDTSINDDSDDVDDVDDERDENVSDSHSENHSENHSDSLCDGNEEKENKGDDRTEGLAVCEDCDGKRRSCDDAVDTNTLNRNTNNQEAGPLIVHPKNNAKKPIAGDSTPTTNGNKRSSKSRKRRTRRKRNKASRKRKQRNHSQFIEEHVSWLAEKDLNKQEQEHEGGRSTECHTTEKASKKARKAKMTVHIGTTTSPITGSDTHHTFSATGNQV